ncbi:MAG: hypothetical protein QF449_06150 [Alphaproteobacteria bacterium]|nr:hypothetical protein [Alphaproteobacteria bacterium]
MFEWVSGRRLRHPPEITPRNCVLQAVVAPKQLTIDREGRRPEDAQRPRLVRRGIECLGYFGGICARDNPGGVVPDLAQAVAEIGVAAYSLAFLKQLFLGCEQILVAPPLFAADEGNPVGQIIFRLLGRIP